ncbi:Glutaredoxin-like protein, YruB-family [Candidatus Thermokryptus mobilis]|uniref:Glutaredoxin-like protein, YruB-family n=1 Tax=Candidatus Thermokryptus mobilis TaxID=1643428 RepID=A0A0S4N0U1_9BACT|nr:Uxx-star family glutaredoxin-like (seleno)protein [Candidatus Thermokryptus mobilis]CUU03485.1 Glutaredoxin-like protein, YruB-family [Candidatus Thermokryptus mobilis]
MNQKQHKVIIFTTPTCPWCRAAKQYFMQKKVKFTEVDVTKNQSAVKDLIRLTGQTGVPVILIDNRPVVGFDKAKIDKLLGLK